MNSTTYIQLLTGNTAAVKSRLGVFAELAKVRITLFVALSTSAGYILQKGTIDLYMLIASLGVFLLAAGSSAINHIQEKELDRHMPRTKNRPLPSGNITVKTAWIFASLLISSGGLLLWLVFNLSAFILGIVSLFWYNVIYTPMKMKNVMAVIPGSLIGALPPIIGWVCAGGNLFEFRILSLALFFFIWQIPHFWLLLMIYSDQYEKAGYPVLTKLFSREQLSRITFSWIVALVFSATIIPLNMSGKSHLSAVFMSLGIILVLFSIKILINRETEKKILRKTFAMINLFVMLVTIILSVDKLLF